MPVELEKQRKLNDLLVRMSNLDNSISEPHVRSDFFLELEDIYYNPNEKNFRHYYSNIFSTLSLIDSRTDCSLDILAENIQSIKTGYRSCNLDDDGHVIDVKDEIVKLYDHVNLEIGRINYIKKLQLETKSELQLVKQQLAYNAETNKTNQDEINQKVEEVSVMSRSLALDMSESQKNMQNEYITILGIFAAIVMAFTGGMTFSTSVLENMHKSSIYRIVGETILIGLILFDVVWMLLEFIRSINGKTIYKRWILWVFNAVAAIGLAGVIVAFKFSWL